MAVVVSEHVDALTYALLLPYADNLGRGNGCFAVQYRLARYVVITDDILLFLKVHTPMHAPCAVDVPADQWSLLMLARKASCLRLTRLR